MERFLNFKLILLIVIDLGSFIMVLVDSEFIGMFVEIKKKRVKNRRIFFMVLFLVDIL